MKEQRYAKLTTEGGQTLPVSGLASTETRTEYYEAVCDPDGREEIKELKEETIPEKKQENSSVLS